MEERVKMLKEVTGRLPNVRIVPFDGLLVNLARQVGAGGVVGGGGAGSPFSMAAWNSASVGRSQLSKS